MISQRRLVWLSIFILLTLLLRDLPYVNVVVINKMWIIYLLILLFIALSSIKFKVSIVLYTTILLFLIAFIWTLLRLNFFADAIGSLIYFSLWIIFIHKSVTFFVSDTA